MSDPKAMLADYVSAVAGHVFTAERAYNVCREIGFHAEAVNSNNFGSALGYVQAVLADHCALSASLTAWRTRRDKRTVHDEAVPAEAIPDVTWAESRQLLDYAKGFVGAMGWAYLSTAYVVDEGRFLLDTDAQRDGIAFARLFRKAGLNRAPGHGTA